LLLPSLSTILKIRKHKLEQNSSSTQSDVVILATKDYILDLKAVFSKFNFESITNEGLVPSAGNKTHVALSSITELLHMFSALRVFRSTYFTEPLIIAFLFF